PDARLAGGLGTNGCAVGPNVSYRPGLVGGRRWSNKIQYPSRPKVGGCPDQGLRPDFVSMVWSPDCPVRCNAQIVRYHPDLQSRDGGVRVETLRYRAQIRCLACGPIGWHAGY